MCFGRKRLSNLTWFWFAKISLLLLSNRFNPNRLESVSLHLLLVLPDNESVVVCSNFLIEYTLTNTQGLGFLQEDLCWLNFFHFRIDYFIHKWTNNLSHGAEPNENNTVSKSYNHITRMQSDCINWLYVFSPVKHFL